MSALFELAIHHDHSPKRRYRGLVGPKNDIDLNLVLRLLLIVSPGTQNLA